MDAVTFCAAFVGKFSGEHISFLLLYVSGIQVVSQSSAYENK